MSFYIHHLPIVQGVIYTYSMDLLCLCNVKYAYFCASLISNQCTSMEQQRDSLKMDWIHSDTNPEEKSIQGKDYFQNWTVWEKEKGAHIHHPLISACPLSCIPIFGGFVVQLPCCVPQSLCLSDCLIKFSSSVESKKISFS